MTEDQQAILDLIRAHEAETLDASRPLLTTMMNPFRRSVLGVYDIAGRLGWTTGETTRSGRLRSDARRAKKAIKELVAAGALEETISTRTLAAGSKSTLGYCTPGFLDRQRQAFEARTSAPEEDGPGGPKP